MTLTENLQKVFSPKRTESQRNSKHVAVWGSAWVWMRERWRLDIIIQWNHHIVFLLLLFLWQEPIPGVSATQTFSVASQVPPKKEYVNRKRPRLCAVVYHLLPSACSHKLCRTCYMERRKTKKEVRRGKTLTCKSTRSRKNKLVYAPPPAAPKDWDSISLADFCCFISRIYRPLHRISDGVKSGVPIYIYSSIPYS
jgi:hypothetical protein